jgi:hypothetical protein
MTDFIFQVALKNRSHLRQAGAQSEARLQLCGIPYWLFLIWHQLISTGSWAFQNQSDALNWAPA